MAAVQFHSKAHVLYKGEGVDPYKSRHKGIFEAIAFNRAAVPISIKHLQEDIVEEHARDIHHM